MTRVLLKAADTTVPNMDKHTITENILAQSPTTIAPQSMATAEDASTCGECHKNCKVMMGIFNQNFNLHTSCVVRTE